MKFLIVYDENTGYTIKLTPYPNGNEVKAFNDFKAEAIANFGKPNLQVHLIGAEDEAELRRVWGRFFLKSSTAVTR